MKVQNHDLYDENDNSFLINPGFKLLIWIIIIGVFLAAIIYFLLQNKINIFSRESAHLQQEDNKDADEDIFHLSYTKLILQAEKEKNYRVAIRLMFLANIKIIK